MLKLFKVFLNDGDWHSGDMPSKLEIAESKEEAIIKVKQNTSRYSRNWDIFAKEVQIEGYEINIRKSV